MSISQLRVCSNCIKFSFELHHGRSSWYQVVVAGPLLIEELTTGKSRMARLKIQPCQYSSYFFHLRSDYNIWMNPKYPDPILIWHPGASRHHRFPSSPGSRPQYHWQNCERQVTSPMRFAFCFSLVLTVIMFSLSCGSDKCSRTFANPGAMTQHWQCCPHYQEQFHQRQQFLRDAASVNPHESLQGPPAKRLKTNSSNESESVVQVSPANFYDLHLKFMGFANT